MSSRALHVLAYTRIKEGRTTAVLDRPALDLVKLARSSGIEVQVDPGNQEHVEYKIRKGEFELLRDPIFLMAVGIPLNLVVSLVANWLSTKNNRSPKEAEAAQVIIGIKDDDNTVFYDHVGREVSDNRVRDLMDLLKSRANSRSTATTATSPFPDMPYPIKLEHSNKVVGWAHLEQTSRGLKANPIRFTDSETLERIRSRDLRGMSISAVVKKSVCEICDTDYSVCPHISGEIYDGKTCANHITELDLDEISVVKTPINEECLFDAQGKGLDSEAD